MPRPSTADRLRSRLLARGRRPARIHSNPYLNQAAQAIVDWYGEQDDVRATTYQMTLWMASVLRVMEAFRWRLVPGYRVVRTSGGQAWHYHCWCQVEGEVVDLGSVYDRKYGDQLEGVLEYHLSTDPAIETRYRRLWTDSRADRDEYNAATMAAQSIETSVYLFCIAEKHGEYAGLRRALQHVFTQAPFSRVMSSYPVSEPQGMELQ